MIKYPWIAAAGIASYYLIAFGLLGLLNLGVSGLAEQIISVFAAPALLSLMLWNSFLRPLGLTDGEWWTLPSPLAIIVIVLLYSCLAFLLVRAVARLSRSAARRP